MLVFHGGHIFTQLHESIRANRSVKKFTCSTAPAGLPLTLMPTSPLQLLKVKSSMAMPTPVALGVCWTKQPGQKNLNSDFFIIFEAIFVSSSGT